MLRKLEINPTAERLIETTVALIDRQGGLQNVNLRKIAQLSGCTHTNVYNYFHNFEELLWTAFERILDTWRAYIAEQCAPDLAPEEAYADFIAHQVDFAMEHPGWYRFIWLDPFFETPPPHIFERFHFLRAAFLDLIMKASASQLTSEHAEQIEEILHSYCHGDLCKLISGRVSAPDWEQHKQRIILRCRELLKLLTAATI